MTFMQCRPNVFNVGPTLHNVIQMFCVYWVTIQTWGSSSFQIPAVIQSVCLQVGDHVGAKDKGFELLPHRCRSSIYELAVIWELALNEALGMKRIFVLLWNRALAYPRTLLPSGGPLSREFWQLTTPLTISVTCNLIISEHEPWFSFIFPTKIAKNNALQM